MSLNFEEEQRRLARIHGADLSETRLTLTPFFAAFSFAWANRWDLLRVGWPLLLAVLVATLAFEPLLGKILGGFLAVAVYFGAAAILAVAVHRWIVFDAPPPPEISFYFRFRPVEWKFALLIAGWWVAFAVAVTLVLVPTALSIGTVIAVAWLFSGGRHGCHS